MCVVSVVLQLMVLNKSPLHNAEQRQHYFSKRPYHNSIPSLISRFNAPDINQSITLILLSTTPKLCSPSTVARWKGSGGVKPDMTER